MKVLEFVADRERIGSKRVRAARFGERSNLPVSAASVVANGFRETLAQVLGGAVGVRLFEPVIPNPAGWEHIAAGATIFRVAGSMADAAIVLRPADAATLAAAAFGERAGDARVLSELESQVLRRIAQALAVHLAPVCGARDALDVVPAERLRGYVTYFDIDTTLPERARIGIALSRDPVPAHNAAVRPTDLADVPIELRAQLESRPLPAARIAALQPGDVLPLMGLEARVFAGGTALGVGEVGIVNGQYGLALRHRTAQETTQ